MQLTKRQQEIKDARDEAKVEQQRLLAMSESAAAEAARLRAELGSREADLAECKNQNSCLSMERMRECAKMGVMEANVESMRAEAQRSIGELGQQHAIAEKLESTLGLLRAELATEQRRAQEAVGVKDALEQRLKSLQDELQALQSDSMSTKAELHSSREGENKALERAEALRKEVDDCTAALRKTEGAVESISAELSACQNEVMSKNHQMKQVEEELRLARIEAAEVQVLIHVNQAMVTIALTVSSSNLRRSVRAGCSSQGCRTVCCRLCEVRGGTENDCCAAEAGSCP